MFDDAIVRVRPPALRWRVVPVAPGESLAGWIAGPVRSVDVHWVNGCSKPCRHRITKGQVLCHCASEPASLRTIGYCPVLTKEREQLVLILSASIIATVRGFPTWAPVEFTRSKKAKTPLRVRAIHAEQLGTSATAALIHNKPNDISEYLLHLWGDTVLEQYFKNGQLPQAAKVPCAVPPAAEIPPAKPKLPLIRRPRAKSAS